MDLDLVLYSDTNFPTTLGRRAQDWFEPLAVGLRSLGQRVAIVAPLETGQDQSLYLRFSHKEAFLRWLARGIGTLVLWTSKPQDRPITVEARRQGWRVRFAEVGWFPQEGTMYVDPDGTGPDSSLVGYEPPELSSDERDRCRRRWPGLFDLDTEWSGPVGVVGQLETDYNLATSPFPRNGDLVATLLSAWPQEKLLFRPHPLQQDVALPQCDRLSVIRGGSLSEFLGQCRAVAGSNSTALLHSLGAGLPVYQLGPGPGHNSGAFLTSLADVAPTRLPAPQRAVAQRLLYDLRFRRQIDLAGGDWSGLRSHPVLGPVLGRSHDHLRATAGACQTA